MRPLLALLLATSVAHAYPVFVPVEEDPPEPLTKLGFRIGGANIPLADQTSLGALSLAIGVDHEVWGATRLFAEYEWMYLHQDTDAMPTFSGMGHRTHLGVRRALATKSIEGLTFYLDGEGGGGLALLESPADAEVMPHIFVGARAGYQITKRRARASRTLEVEVQIRAILLEHGTGIGGGLGFWWGD